MINSACERIKELEAQVRELSVAAEGYRAQRDAAVTERDQLAARLASLEVAAYGVMDTDEMNDEEDIATMWANLNDALMQCGEVSLARHDAELLRRLADEYDRAEYGHWGQNIAMEFRSCAIHIEDRGND